MAPIYLEDTARAQIQLFAATVISTLTSPTSLLATLYKAEKSDAVNEKLVQQSIH